MACVHHPEVEAGIERCARCAGSFCPDCFVVLRDRPYCAACKVELVRDLRSGLVPNALALASVGRRLLGLWVDGFLTAAASYALLIPIMIPIIALSDPGPGRDAEPGALPVVLVLLVYPILFAVPVVYEGFMLQRRGQTLGKMMIGVKVVTPEGGPIGPGQAWGRAALKLVLGSCMGIDYLPALFTRERTCLHDLIARTRVVRLEP
jgi:uncharacterized RDD family membrane protein YckC